MFKVESSAGRRLIHPTKPHLAATVQIKLSSLLASLFVHAALVILNISIHFNALALDELIYNDHC